jgi:hypothetical protein
MYTVEVFKRDARKKEGERLVTKIDTDEKTAEQARIIVSNQYPISKNYRVEVHQTMVTRTNMMGGAEYQERYDTPRYCSPSSEAYWSM